MNRRGKLGQGVEGRRASLPVRPVGRLRALSLAGRARPHSRGVSEGSQGDSRGICVVGF